MCHLTIQQTVKRELFFPLLVLHLLLQAFKREEYRDDLLGLLLSMETIMVFPTDKNREKQRMNKDGVRADGRRHKGRPEEASLLIRWVVL